MSHEQSYADIFRDFMREESDRLGYRFHAFSLDGQDRDVGADYLLTDSDRFSIIEFKYDDNKLITEKFKPRRLTLCQKLLEREDMTTYHDKCHYISWTDSDTGDTEMNIYRYEICNKFVFGNDSGLLTSCPISSKRFSAESFSEGFFESNKNSLSLAEFEAYIMWVLTETSASTKNSLELLVRNPNKKTLNTKTLNSLQEAQKWVQEHVAVQRVVKRRRQKP
ncbi:hypothetical protein P4S52_15725 [Vibrio sp. SA48]